MNEDNRNAKLNRLEALLRDAVCLLPTQKVGDAQELNLLFNKICTILFKDGFYQQIWDERILSQIKSLFGVKKPKQDVFGLKLSILSARTTIVQQINDLFFAVIDNKTPPEQVGQKFALLVPVDRVFMPKFVAMNKLKHIRLSQSSPSDKIASFLEHLTQDFLIDLGEQKAQLQNCLDALKYQEGRGRVNALLINTTTNAGVLIPLEVIVQPGKGEVICHVPGSEDFKVAIERAKSAVLNGGFLRPTDDVLYSLGLTKVGYTGDSIPLAAAVAMYLVARGQILDPYTAFTGNINIDRGEWKIKGISGISQKLETAVQNGCRRVFVPEENQVDVDEAFFEDLQVIFVSDLIEVLMNLQSRVEPIYGDSMQVKKINLLQAFCRANGWHLSQPKTIQSGLQFIVAPFEPPDLKINIYNTGTHMPKSHPHLQFAQLLDDLAAFDETQVPIRKVETSFLIKDPDLRIQIREALDGLKPVERREEKYCEYFYQFEREQEKLIVKQFTNGKIQLQGNAGRLLKDVLEVIVPRYNLKHPQAKLSVDTYLDQGVMSSPTIKIASRAETTFVPFPHIGTDESGKGDYFGPMVVAGVWVDEKTKLELEKLGIRDSKLLSDKRCRELAAEIRKMCRGKYAEVEILPDRYNELYEQFKKEGKNLNHLLAWGHARAIENLLEKLPCSHAVADQFGDEKYILSKVMEKGKKIELIQTTKGERYPAVAAASILARDRFLARMEKFSLNYGIALPKGSSEAVVLSAKQIADNRGETELRKVVKVHHKTTQKVLGGKEQ